MKGEPLPITSYNKAVQISLVLLMDRLDVNHFHTTLDVLSRQGKNYRGQRKSSYITGGTKVYTAVTDIKHSLFAIRLYTKKKMTRCVVLVEAGPALG